MRQPVIHLVLGAALALSLTACSSGTAPDVTPMPTVTPAPTTNMDKPMTTDDAHYNADDSGQVDGTLSPEGSITNNAIHKTENAVRHAADDVARGVERATR